jgi:hypothetical protein
MKVNMTGGNEWAHTWPTAGRTSARLLEISVIEGVIGISNS